MVFRPWGDKLPDRGRVPGGVPAMRPDQRAAQALTRAGSGPAPQNTTFFGRLVVVFGTGFFGVFVYSPVPGAGNLIASITSSHGTDPYGNVYQAGVSSYGAAGLFNQVSGSTVAFGSTNVATFITSLAEILLIDTVAASVSPALELLSPGTTGGGNGAIVRLYGTSNDGSKVSQVQVTTVGTGVTRGTSALLEIEGTTALKNSIAPGSVTGYAEPFANNGHLYVVDGTDGVTYGTQRVIYEAAGQLVNSTTFAVIPAVGGGNVAGTLQPGVYRIQGEFAYTANQAAGAPNIGWEASGGIVASFVSISCLEFTAPSGGGAVTLGNGNRITALGGTFNGATFTSIGEQVFMRFEGTLTVTTAGTFLPKVSCSVAIDTYNLLQGSYMTVMPE
jgi:hypothetical protein